VALLWASLTRCVVSMEDGWDYLAQTSQVRLVLQLFRRHGLAISVNPNEEVKGAFGVSRMHDYGQEFATSYLF